jgi:hypothetical protein
MRKLLEFVAFIIAVAATVLMLVDYWSRHRSMGLYGPLPLVLTGVFVAVIVGYALRRFVVRL